MAKLLPHAGGKEQIIVYRVRSGTNNDPSHTGAVITPPEKETAGIYYAAVQYAEAYPRRFGSLRPTERRQARGQQP